MNIDINAEEIAKFQTFSQWVNKASLWLGHSKRTHVLICLDKAGNICQIGEDFMAARDFDLFPVTAYLIEKTISAINITE
jgi:hypothetical protein